LNVRGNLVAVGPGWFIWRLPGTSAWDLWSVLSFLSLSSGVDGVSVRLLVDVRLPLCPSLDLVVLPPPRVELLGKTSSGLGWDGLWGL